MGKEVLKLCMSKGFLLDKETLGLMESLEENNAAVLIDMVSNLNLGERVITKRLFQKNQVKFSQLINSGNSDFVKFFSGIGIEGFSGSLVEDENTLEEKFGKIKLLSAPAFPQKKIEVRDFVEHFRSRYEAIKGILERRDFENLSSIRKIGQNRGSFTIIAMVIDKRTTKNKNLFIEVEDVTGKSVVLVNQNKPEVFEKAKDLLPDDIVAFSVSGTSEMLFANDIIFPDSVLEEKRYAEFEEYVAFSGDLHAGSTMFLEKNFMKFVKWLNGEEGDETQRALAKKVKYLFLTGDNIDGVNHYPGQERYLIEKTSIGQYGLVEKLLKLIRKNVQIIICPGQHDAVWVGEPQPIIGEDLAPGLHKMENVHLVPNPALVEIDGGFKVLMYHGASINRFIDEIPEIRTNHGHNNPTRVVKEMLKRRHLAPIHGGMDYIPCSHGDPLVIKEIPDIVNTADQHRPEVSTHNNILMIAGSCWQSITPFEEKVGNVPDPCKVPLFNLKTREIKMLDFSDDPKEIRWDNSEELVCYLAEETCGPRPKEKIVEWDDMAKSEDEDEE